MSTASADVSTHDEADHHDHPSDWAYMKIAVVLAVLTAIEVALYYFPPGGAEVPSLLILMVVKFAIVALYFMHLKLDSKLLTWVFLIGVLMALAVYIATLTAFEFWA